MSVLIVEKDPFVELIDSKSENVWDQNKNVRRPLYGVRIKPNRFAFLAVWQITSTGKARPISLVDSSAPGGQSHANHNFLLQSAQESRQEKVQIVETFGDHYSFFYGQRPIIYNCGGQLINTRDFNWKNEWLHNYENYLRGTKCVENRARIYLGFDDILIEGYILSCGVSYDASMPYLCPFNFQMLVIKQVDLDLSRSMNTTVTSANGTNLTGGGGVGARALFGSGTLVNGTGQVVEYLTGLQATGYNVVDPATGDVKEEASAGNTGGVPMSISDGSRNNRSAYWITSGRADRQWHSEDDALLGIDREVVAQQTGQDRLTVARSQLSGGSTPLSTRSASASLRASLGTGVANAAATIEDPE